MKKQSAKASKVAARQQHTTTAPVNLFTPPLSAPNRATLLHPAPHPLRDTVFQQLQQINAPVLRASNLALSSMITNPLGYKRTVVPFIRLSGKWLHDVGFTQMDRYFLYAYDGMIILVPQGPPPSAAARESWYEVPGIGRKRKQSAEVIKMELLSQRYQASIVNRPDHNHF